MSDYLRTSGEKFSILRPINDDDKKMGGTQKKLCFFRLFLFYFLVLFLLEDKQLDKLGEIW